MAGKWRLKTMDDHRLPRACCLYNTGVSLVSTRWLSKLAQVFPRSTLLIDVPLLLRDTVTNKYFSLHYNANFDFLHIRDFIRLVSALRGCETPIHFIISAP